MEANKQRTKYDRQFKIDAVNLVVNGNRSVAAVARDLEIDANSLYRWKRELSAEG
jgi:transposase-like protein